jgi:hypothetical protein
MLIARLCLNFQNMILRLILACFMFNAGALAQSNNHLIDWTSTRKLTWDDFRATPPSDASNAALTSSGILINFNYNDQSLNFEITCNFDKSKSWGRIKNDHILAHEQAHFDITELHARKLYKSLKEYRFKKATVSKDIHEIYEKVVLELQQMQNDYDRETDHSRNFFQQKNWLTRIENELNAYSAWSGYGK